MCLWGIQERSWNRAALASFLSRRQCFSGWARSFAGRRPTPIPGLRVTVETPSDFCSVESCFPFAVPASFKISHRDAFFFFRRPFSPALRVPSSAVEDGRQVLVAIVLAPAKHYLVAWSLSFEEVFLLSSSPPDFLCWAF